jgi:uncharacterized phage protein (TIGR01671 family)
MSREIKFRAFSDRMWQWEEIRKEFDVWTFSSDPLMQFTGLKDKDGKEIYEGDLLHRHMGVYWEAAFVNSSWIGKSLIDSGIYLSASQFIETEIIGNIYENPELLT